MKVLSVSAIGGNGPSPAIADHIERLSSDFGVDFDHVHVHVDRRLAYSRALTEMARKLRADSYDLVHAFYGHCGLLGRLQRRAPLLVTFQGSDVLGGIDGALHGRDGRIGRAVAGRADGVVVMSDEMATVLDRPDAHVIPFGVNTEIFRPSDRIAAQRALGMDPSVARVLFPYDPARVEKHHGIVAEAVALVRDRGVDIELITLVGRERGEVASHMVACDALALASDHEGSPVAVREALACGLPVVSVDVGDVVSVLAGRSACHIVERDPAAMADALHDVIADRRRTPSEPDARLPDVAATCRRLYAVYTTTAALRR